MLDHVLLVEDHPIVRMGLRQLITAQWPATTVHEASTLAEALRLLQVTPIPIAVVDLNLPDAAALEAVSSLRKARPDLRLLVLSLHAEEAYARRTLQLGAAGYLSKDRAAGELTRALEHIAAGGRYLTASQAQLLADVALGQSSVDPHEDLSPQELRVMIHLAAGRRLTEIAEMMHLSPKTITTYRTRILDKLGVESNNELVRYCLDRGLSL